MFAGETILTGGKHPGTDLKVMESHAGFYLGFALPSGEPYSRETQYMTQAQAEEMLKHIRSC